MAMLDAWARSMTRAPRRVQLAIAMVIVLLQAAALFRAYSVFVVSLPLSAGVVGLLLGRWAVPGVVVALGAAALVRVSLSEPGSDEGDQRLLTAFVVFGLAVITGFSAVAGTVLRKHLDARRRELGDHTGRHAG